MIYNKCIFTYSFENDVEVFISVIVVAGVERIIGRSLKKNATTGDELAVDSACFLSHGPLKKRRHLLRILTNSVILKYKVSSHSNVKLAVLQQQQR